MQSGGAAAWEGPRPAPRNGGGGAALGDAGGKSMADWHRAARWVFALLAVAAFAAELGLRQAGR